MTLTCTTIEYVLFYTGQNKLSSPGDMCRFTRMA